MIVDTFWYLLKWKWMTHWQGNRTLIFLCVLLLVISMISLIKQAAEDRAHFILHCQALHAVHAKYMTKITDIIPLFCDRNTETQITYILDSNAYPMRELREKLEATSHLSLFRLHCKRTAVLNINTN